MSASDGFPTKGFAGLTWPSLPVGRSHPFLPRGKRGSLLKGTQDPVSPCDRRQTGQEGRTVAGRLGIDASTFNLNCLKGYVTVPEAGDNGKADTGKPDSDRVPVETDVTGEQQLIARVDRSIREERYWIHTNPPGSCPGRIARNRYSPRSMTIGPSFP